MQGELPIRKPGENMSSFGVPSNEEQAVEATAEEQTKSKERPAREIPALYKRFIDSQTEESNEEGSRGGPESVQDLREAQSDTARRQAEITFYLRHGRKPKPGEDLTK